MENTPEKEKEKEKEKEIVNRFSNFGSKMGTSVPIDPNALIEGKFDNSRFLKKTHQYTKEEAEQIIKEGNPEQLTELSRFFYDSSGFYKRLLSYYATILYYIPLIIPHMKKNNKEIKDSKILDKYYSALEFSSNINFRQLCNHFAKTVLTEGAYYGMIKEADGEFSIQDLPYEYCRTRFKSFSGVDIVEFDVTWFDLIKDTNSKIEVLNSFPKEIRKGYNKYKKGKLFNSWIKLPVEKGIHFSLFGEKPFFSSVIPSIINFNDYVVLEKKKDTKNTKSVIVQELPHTANGDLVFSPEEALEFHQGLANVAKNNEFLDAITSYGTVHEIKLNEDDAASKDNLSKISSILYSESGVSKQLFSAEGNISLEKSIQNDITLITVLSNSFAIWLKNLLNFHFSNKKVSFDVVIPPVGQYNIKDYQSQTLNAAQYGYSLFLPSISMYLEQNQLLDLKVLENEALNLVDLLVPLHSSHTESNSDENNSTKTELEQKEAESKGASKEEEERSDKTIQNKETSNGGEKE